MQHLACGGRSGRRCSEGGSEYFLTCCSSARRCSRYQDITGTHTCTPMATARFAQIRLMAAGAWHTCNALAWRSAR